MFLINQISETTQNLQLKVNKQYLSFDFRVVVFLVFMNVMFTI